MLTISVLLFIIITAVELGTGTDSYHLNDFIKPVMSTNIISGIGILCTAYAYQTSVFPAYAAMD